MAIGKRTEKALALVEKAIDEGKRVACVLIRKTVIYFDIDCDGEIARHTISSLIGKRLKKRKNKK